LGRVERGRGRELGEEGKERGIYTLALAQEGDLGADRPSETNGPTGSDSVDPGCPLAVPQSLHARFGPPTHIWKEGETGAGEGRSCLIEDEI
jgi:hypothetical protein